MPHVDESVRAWDDGYFDGFHSEPYRQHATRPANYTDGYTNGVEARLRIEQEKRAARTAIIDEVTTTLETTALAELNTGSRFLKLPSGMYLNADQIQGAGVVNNALVVSRADGNDTDLYGADRDALIAWLDLNSEAI